MLLFSSYLASGHELQGTQGALHVRDVGLELIESGRDVLLDLGGLGPRWGVGRDLVERLRGRHLVGDVGWVEGGGGGW